LPIIDIGKLVIIIGSTPTRTMKGVLSSTEEIVINISYFFDWIIGALIKLSHCRNTLLNGY
jgi:hypothetical protein